MRWPRLVYLYETPLWRRNPFLARANGISLSNELAFIEDAAENLPFAPASFDVVNCCGALHNFDDLDRALAGVVQVLRSGGRFIVAMARKPPESDA